MEENIYNEIEEIMKEQEDINDAFLNTFNLYNSDFDFSIFNESKQYWLLSEPLSDQTFNNLITYYEDKEEFEKCQILMDRKGKRDDYWQKIPNTTKYQKIFKHKK